MIPNEMIRNMPSKKSEKGKNCDKKTQSGKGGKPKERSSVSRKIRNSRNSNDKENEK